MHISPWFYHGLGFYPRAFSTVLLFKRGYIDHAGNVSTFRGKQFYLITLINQIVTLTHFWIMSVLGGPA